MSVIVLSSCINFIIFGHQDKHANLKIHSYVDEVMSKVMTHLGLMIPEYKGPCIVLTSSPSLGDTEGTSEATNLKGTVKEENPEIGNRKQNCIPKDEIASSCSASDPKETTAFKGTRANHEGVQDLITKDLKLKPSLKSENSAREGDGKCSQSEVTDVPNAAPQGSINTNKLHQTPQRQDSKNGADQLKPNPQVDSSEDGSNSFCNNCGPIGFDLKQSSSEVQKASALESLNTTAENQHQMSFKCLPSLDNIKDKTTSHHSIQYIDICSLPKKPKLE